MDLYAVLGLDASATQAQVRQAYRQLVRRHHPDTRVAPADPDERAVDTTPSDESLRRVLVAYAVLGDPVRRAEYDRTTRGHGVDRAPRQHPRGQPIQAGPVYWQPAT